MRSTPAMDANSRMMGQGVQYWSPGPITGTFWALTSGGDPVVVDRDGGQIVAGAPGVTRGQSAAAERGRELARSVRVGGQPYYVNGSDVLGLREPMGEHEHDDDTDPAGCYVLVPFSRTAPCQAVHVRAVRRNRPPAAA